MHKKFLQIYQVLVTVCFTMFLTCSTHAHEKLTAYDVEMYPTLSRARVGDLTPRQHGSLLQCTAALMETHNELFAPHSPDLPCTECDNFTIVLLKGIMNPNAIESVCHTSDELLVPPEWVLTALMGRSWHSKHWSPAVGIVSVAEEKASVEDFHDKQMEFLFKSLCRPRKCHFCDIAEVQTSTDRGIQWSFPQDQPCQKRVAQIYQEAHRRGITSKSEEVVGPGGDD